jgi:hypothetical protein
VVKCAIVLACLTFGFGCAPQMSAQGNGTLASKKAEKNLVHATVYLLPRPGILGKPCLIRTVPQVIEAQEKKQEVVVWSVVDMCGGTSGTSEVEIDMGVSEAEDPFDACTVRKSKQVIRCKLKRTTPKEKYKYVVRVTDASKADPEDPELEIVM